MASTSIEGRLGFRRAVLLAAALAFSACRQGHPALAPLPEIITGLEGDGSLTLTGPEATSRSRFSFLFDLPSRARIDVFDPLGRVAYFLIMADGEAAMAVPSKKAFSRGRDEEVMARFLGFGMTPEEMMSLLTGRWNGIPEGDERARGEAWILRRNEENKVVSGERGDLSFEVKEFFARSSAPRLVVFEHPATRGRLKVNGLSFNRPREGAADAAVLLRGYAEKNWEEMERLLRDED